MVKLFIILKAFFSPLVKEVGQKLFFFACNKQKVVFLSPCMWLQIKRQDSGSGRCGQICMYYIIIGNIRGEDDAPICQRSALFVRGGGAKYISC